MHDDLTSILDKLIRTGLAALKLSKARNEILPCGKSIVKTSYINRDDVLTLILAVSKKSSLHF